MRRRPSRATDLGRRAALLALALCAAAPPAAGQTPLRESEDLAFHRPEAWGMAYFSSINLLTGFGAPEASEPGDLEIGVELAWIPSLSEAERTIGFYGTKTEDLNKTSLFGRPRLALGLPRDLTLTLSYVPPIEISDVEPHLFAAALGRPLAGGERWRLGGRLVGQTGTMKGDLTCPRSAVEAGADRRLNPFGCEVPSRDRITIVSSSFELAAARAPRGTAGLEPYLGAALNWFDLDFDVRALYSGIDDRSQLTTEGTSVSLTAGVAWRGTGRLRAALELFYTPLEIERRRGAPIRTEELVNVRTFLSYRLR